jgi:stage III sporulation protein AA
MLDFLSENLKEGIARLNLAYLYELRIRADKPVIVNYQGEYRFLGLFGLTNIREKSIFCTAYDIEEIVFRAGEYSVYSVEEQIKSGFLTAKNGERIGLSGEYVFDKGQPTALRNVTSLCIRVPHEINGCAKEVYKICMSDKIQNLLLMSPPGLGKTTILRDLARILSEKTRKNILICDERGELSVGALGDTCDVVRFCDKERAFLAGIRAMRPEIIITDELSLRDCEILQNAVSAGIIVIASAHFSDISYVKSPFLGLFERFVLLDSDEIGKIKAIYGAVGEKIYG